MQGGVGAQQKCGWGIFDSRRRSIYCWVFSKWTPDMECHVASPVGSTVSGALALNDLIMALKDVHQQNFPASLLLLGAQVMSMYYEQIFTIAGQVTA